jgi:hypothetical protein
LGGSAVSSGGAVVGLEPAAVFALFERGFGGGSLPPSAGGAPAVDASAKNSDDGKDVLDELGLGGRGGGSIRVCVHCDDRSVLTEHVLAKIECEPTEPVTVGNVHRA